MASMRKPLLVALVGPTASGKSHLALQAAQRLHGEIVNCDSMQMYRSLEIGTGKPARSERERVPHHLYGFLAPEEYFSAGLYMQEARRVCRNILERGRLPFVVGGTGLYLRALLEGVFEGPGRSREIRERLESLPARHGPDSLHRLLRRKDPESANRIHPADRVRIIRTLEVYFLTGQPIGELHGRRRPMGDVVPLKVALRLPRPILYGRIDRRVEQMFQEGLIDETRRLLEDGANPACKGFEAIGYRNAVGVLKGTLSRAQAIEKTQQETRRYAKRQLTWFAREEGLLWIDGPGEEPAALERFLDLIEARLEDGMDGGSGLKRAR